MRIVLLSPPYLPEYMRNARCDFVSLSATQWYPLLLGYCGAYLASKGHEVKLIDAPAHHLDHAATRQIVRAYAPELLVLYTGFKSEENDLRFSGQLIEELGCEAVIVGPFASIDPDGTLSRTQVSDKLIVGEFEHPVAELAEGRKLSEIRNLIYKAGNQIIHNDVRPYLTTAELDAISFISRFLSEQVDLYRYKTPSEAYPFMDMLTGRGCQWGQCTYCLWVHTYVQGMTYNVRRHCQCHRRTSFHQARPAPNSICHDPG